MLPIIVAVLLAAGTSTTVTVDAQSNIFAAADGDLQNNGGGKMPPGVDLPAGVTIVTFPSVTGRVSCCSGGTTFNGPDGGTNVSTYTNITSSSGISGIIHRKRTMFLVGVFIGGSNPSPLRLDVTDAAAQSSVWPKLNQTFYIGSGKSPHGLRVVHVPAGAAHLAFGFADGTMFHGAPGDYNDNVGLLQVVVQAR